MRIYAMTATFGKLEHQTLTLEPGLNVIHAPNEWGKSTWCAFIVAMLYGIDTRERNTMNTLADKERYKPWSGAPMSGRMDIQWNGRDITIERSTKGRSVMGQFNAYETTTGLPVPELTADNCGEMLLGVEKSVFVRSGFVRQSDMPVTNDESLRRRLNALVTTGDESGASDMLAQKLKELKNNCRHNRTGLLPQAETQRATVKDKLLQLEQLEQKCQGIHQRQKQLLAQIRLLDNHRVALEYAAAQEDLRRIEDAAAARDAAAAVMQEATQRCQAIPAEETAQTMLAQLTALQQQWNALQAIPQPIQPEPVQVPASFAGLTGEQAVVQASSDTEVVQKLSKPMSPVLLICAGVSVAAGAGLAFLNWLFSIPMAALAVALMVIFFIQKGKKAKRLQAVLSRYGLIDSKLWIPMAQKYRTDCETYVKENSNYRYQLTQLQERRDNLTQQTVALTQGQPLAATITGWEKIIADHAAMAEAQRNWKQASDHAAALEAMAKPVQEPEFPDDLSLTQQQTQQAVAEATVENRQLDMQLGQCHGQMQTLGQKELLETQLDQINQRIAKLEDTYNALTIAQETLSEAADILQRRFAPKITNHAQSLFSQLTGGRYNRLLLGQDFSVSAGAQGEDTLRGGMWRSDGTVDQLYLALRLAVAEELTPQAPLVLDDALVRFDDDRLALTMEILQAEAEKKQVILFTCQGREASWKS